MRTKAEFIALLERYELPADLFKITEHNEKENNGTATIEVSTPHGIIIRTGDDPTEMVYEFVSKHLANSWYEIPVNFDDFFAPYVAEQNIRREHAKLLEENAELRQKNAALIEENAAKKRQINVQ